MPRSQIKLFLFDRDSSLIDRNNQLFNPHIMIPFLKEITSYHPWGIVSTGGSEVNFAPELQQLKQLSAISTFVPIHRWGVVIPAPCAQCGKDLL